MMIAGIVIWLIWEIPQVFNIVFYWIPNEPHPGAAVGAYGVRYEWHFRSGLDHYSTFYGMLFALNFPQAKLWLEQVSVDLATRHELTRMYGNNIGREDGVEAAVSGERGNGVGINPGYGLVDHTGVCPSETGIQRGAPLCVHYPFDLLHFLAELPPNPPPKPP